jgi:DNA-binding CsgD family transcriptional regulator
MHDPKQRKRLNLYQEVFRPVRVVRQMALAQPLPQGEALLIAGFDETRVPEYDGARHQIMQILAPVFETSLKLRLRFKGARPHFEAIIDSLPEALVAFCADGEEHYRNQAFQNLPLGESGRAAVARASHELAAKVCQTLRATPPSQPLTAQRDLSLPSGSYELRAFTTPSLLTRPGVMVWVERDALLPPPGQLEAHYGLTPRQAEVALLMAKGLSNRAIAERLVISPHTARRHAEKVLKKMNLSSRAGVALACVQPSPSG